MATTPTEIQKIEADVKKVFSFGMAHLVLICLLAGAVCFGFYEWDNRKAQAADAKALILEAKGQQADADNVKYQANTKAQIEALQQQNAILQSQYSNMMNVMAARDAALAKQQQIIAQMPPTQLAGTWQDAIKIPDSVTPQANGTYQVTQPAAVATVQALASVSTLTQDKATLTAANTNLTGQLSNETTAFTAEAAAHVKDNATCTTDKAVLNGTITKVKADAKKSKWHWFVAGFIGGLVTGHFAGI